MGKRRYVCMSVCVHACSKLVSISVQGIRFSHFASLLGLVKDLHQMVSTVCKYRCVCIQMHTNETFLREYRRILSIMKSYAGSQSRYCRCYRLFGLMRGVGRFRLAF